MNIVFVVEDSSEALALKNELARLVQAAKASESTDAKNLPVDLRHVTVERVGVSQDGRVQLPENGLFPGDIIVLDMILTGERTQHAIRDAKKRVPGVPIIILADPKDDSAAAGAIGAGAADCIDKTENYLARLIPIIERESRYQALKREKLETLSREKRIRLIIENLPAGVAVIAPEGTLLAVNFSGLRLLGFAKLEHAVGKNVLHFTRGEDFEKLKSLLGMIGKGESASVNLNWEAPDGTTLGIRMDATPMQKQGIQGSAILAAIHSLEDDGENPEAEIILQESEKKLQKLEEDHALEKTRWEEAIRHEESLRRETEDQQQEVQAALQEAQDRLASLKTAYDDSEENRDKLARILNTERSKWNQIIQDHEAALQTVEEQRSALEAKIGELEETRRLEADDLQKERSGWEESRRQLEGQVRKLEEKQAEVQTALQDAGSQLSAIERALRESEENRKLQTEEQEAARSGWEQSRLILEQKATSAEEQRAFLESARQAAEERNAELQEKLQSVEDARAALEARLTEAAENRSKTGEILDEERARWEQIRFGLEQKANEAEQQKASLESAKQAVEERNAELQAKLRSVEDARADLESRLTEAAENRNKTGEILDEERARWEQIRFGLEQKVNEAEQQKASLESAKQAAEERNAELDVRLSDTQEARAALETRVAETDRELAALKAQIEESEETRHAEAEGLRRELSEREEMRLAMERKVREAEEQRASLESAKQSAEERNAELDAKLQDLQEVRAALETRVREVRESRHETNEALAEERARSEQVRQQMEQEIRELKQKQAEVQTALQEASGQLSVIEAALGKSEENRRQQTERFETERADWDRLRLELEQKAREDEERRAFLESAKQAAEARNAELEAKLDDIQQAHTALETRLREVEESRHETNENLKQERSRSEQVRQQLEQEIRELREKQVEVQTTLQEAGRQLSNIEAALGESEESRRRQTEEFDAERTGWDQLRLAMEQKAREDEEQRAFLESAKRAAEARNAELEAQRKDMQEARAALETRFKEADEAREALKTKMENLEKIWRAEVEDLRGEITLREQMNSALEQKLFEREEQQSSLQSALLTAEEGRSALEAALRQVEEEQKGLLAQHEAETEHWEQMSREWQDRLRQSEEQHAVHLQNVLKNEEERYHRLYEDHQANKSYIKEIQQQTAGLRADLERLRAELLEAKNRYQRMSGVPGFGVAVTTLEGRVLECNEAAAHMFGYADSRDALSLAEGKEAFHMFPYQGALGTRLQREGFLENVDWSLLNGQGRMYRFRENVKLARDASGESALMERVFTDITEEHKLSEEVRRMRRADPSGDAFTSAVRILKNLNESLVRHGRNLQSAAEDSETVKNIAGALESDAGRSSKYINQLIAVSSKADRILTVVDLNDILEENDEVLRNLTGDAIDLRIERIPEGSLIAADRGELVQLILSTVVGSLKSLPLGGSITVRTENVEMEASAASCKDGAEHRSGLYVELTIGTDGCGMTPDNMPAFNQATVDRIGGWSESSNDPQSGHVHKIYLPRVVAVPGKKSLPHGMIEVRLADETAPKSNSPNPAESARPCPKKSV